MSGVLLPVNKVGDAWVVDNDFSVLDGDDIPALEDGIGEYPKIRGVVGGKEVDIWVSSTPTAGYALADDVGDA